MKKKNYSDKLKNPNWQKKRLEVLNLRGFKCELCGCETKELHVHHRFYLKGRDIWEYDNDVFQVLCCDCHEKEHSKINKQIEVVPEKYKKLIYDIEACSEIRGDNLESISFIIEAYLKYIQDEDFLSNLATVCNSGYLDKLKYDIMSAAIEEDNSIRLAMLTNQVRKLEDTNNGLWHILGVITDYIELNHPKILNDIRNIKTNLTLPLK